MNIVAKTLKKKKWAEFDKYIFSTSLLKQGKQTYGDIY